VTDAEVEKVMETLRPHLRRATDRITTEVNAAFEVALAPAKGLGLLPLTLGGGLLGRRVYNPFLPWGIEARCGLDHFGRDLKPANA